MTARNHTGQPDKRPSTESESIDGSTTRRRLLGGAAALATIPAAAGGQPTDDSSSDEGGDSQPTGEHSGLWAAVDMGEVIDDDVELGVTGVALDDEPGSVALAISTTPAGIHLDMSPSRAREFASDLLEAADAAEGGE